MGRPVQGALSTFSKKLRDKIKAYRVSNEGWGAISILVELKIRDGYLKTELPSANAVHLFLKQEGLISVKERTNPLPVTPCQRPEAVHDLWEMDAKGAMKVSGIGYQSLINVKDGLSKKYCMTFPVAVGNANTQPSKVHYQWVLRLAFLESGLPKGIQVDKDSVFIENSCKSPFPSKMHLWLIGLGINFCFIEKPPPAYNAMVERSHLTLKNQVIKGKEYENWRAFFDNCNLRRKRLNEKYPSRSFSGKAPLEAYPEAKHSGRSYSLKQEHRRFSLKKVEAFLSLGKWYRKVAGNKCAHIGGQRYYLKDAKANSSVSITFCPKTKKLFFYDVNEQEIAQHPIKGLSKQNLIGATTSEIVEMYKLLMNDKDFPLKKKKTNK